MSPKLFPEDKEDAKIAFNKVKGDSGDSVSLFEVVDALKSLGIVADSDQLYQENKSWDVTFDKFCEIYEKKKDEKEKLELRNFVIQSFAALGGKPNQQGVIDVSKLSEIFKFYGLDLEPEDFFSHAGCDYSNILFDDFLQIFDLTSGHQ